MAAPPPSYNEAFADKAIIPSSSNEAPPAYNDLFPGMKDVREQVQRARSGTEEGQAGSAAAVPVAVCDLLCKSVFCGCCYLILAALPIAMIVIGSIYLHDCNANDRIPIFLIVFGVFSLVQTCCGLAKMVLCRVKDEDDEATQRRKKGSNFGEGLLTTFLIIWVIIGSVWVFGAWNTWNDADRPNCPGGSDCCNPVLMYFSFSVLIMMYGLVALACCCFICCVCCIGMLASASK